jgi:hypothetical protein
MKVIVDKLKPANGFSHVVHLLLQILLAFVLFVLVRMHFIQLAFILILLSKWRMFAVRPRFWPANIRANSVDIIVGVSALLLMTHTDLAMWQALWAALYALWLIAVKPGSSILMTSLQAGIGFLAGLTAIFYAGATGALYEIVILTALVCYLAARHFFDSFEEPYAKLLSYLWGYFGAALVWVLGHWLLYYGVAAQPTVLLVAIGYGLGALYYLDHFDKLSAAVKRQFIFIMFAIVAIVLALSNWGHKIV